MNKKIIPAELKGNVTVPSSKSINHRAIIAASLSPGLSTLYNVSLSDDITATIRAVEALGAVVSKDKDTLKIKGIDINNATFNDEYTINCNESGSTLRFLIPILSLIPAKFTLLGEGLLLKRPMGIYEGILREANIEHQFSTEKIIIDAREHQLKSGSFKLEGNVSSQFITGLMFALPLLKGDSTIELTSNLESVGYVNMTIDVLSDFGVVVNNDGYQNFTINGNQQYQHNDYEVEGDYSQSAFFLVANFLGHHINLLGLNEESLQGDKEIVSFLERLSKAEGPLVFDGQDCPDIIPVFALACSLGKVPVKIINIERLRIKECDRLAATVSELNKLGADLIEFEDAIGITPVEYLEGNATVSSHNDHRIAMMLGIAGSVTTSPIVIDNASAVSKSYPDFWDVYEELGGIALSDNTD